MGKLPIWRRGLSRQAAVCIYLSFAIGAVVVPIGLSKLNLPIVSNTYGKDYEPFELFGFCAAGALALVGYFEIKRHRTLDAGAVFPILACLVVGFHFLILTAEYSSASWDYACYERAARAVTEGRNPYGTSHWYLYPPLTAEAMASAYRVLEACFSALRVDAAGPAAWSVVFYLYQCAQFFLVIAAYLLCHGFARNLGMSNQVASLLVAAVLVCNNPLVRTVRHNQVNLWVLDMMLLSALCLGRRPRLSGLSVAIAAHIKVYPALLLVPWTVMKKWRAVLWMLGSFAAVVLVECTVGPGLVLWRQFAAMADSFPKGMAYRDNSLHSLIYNCFDLARRAMGTGEGSIRLPVSILVGLATLAVAVWYVRRCLAREQYYRSALKAERPRTDVDRASTERSYGHFADTIALMLLISPVVWEHHYVLAIPIVLWAAAVQGNHKPWLVGAAAFLIFAIPTFDVFPFSYNRLAGLLLLMRATSPPTHLWSKSLLQGIDDTDGRQ